MRHDRPTYERSGRVAGRFWPMAIVVLFVAAGMGYLWFLAYDTGHGYLVVTPAIMSIPVAIAAFLAVRIGHCRNRFVAWALGVLAAIVLQAAYFHFDRVHREGRDALIQLERLPAFIQERMATDGVGRQVGFLPHNELYNWLYAGADFAVIAFCIGGLAVYRSLTGYCESCHRWMRSIALRTKPGSADDIAEALETEDYALIPDIVGSPRLVQSAAWIEFEYCPGLREPLSECAAYLTLREYGNATEFPDTRMYQGRLTDDELNALSKRVSALSFLRVTAPVTEPDESGTGQRGPIERHAGSYAAIQQLPAEAGGKLLDGAGKIEFVIALIPVSAALIGIGLTIWGLVRTPWSNDPQTLLGWLPLLVGLMLAIPGGLVCWINVDYLGLRYMVRWLRRIHAQRGDALVSIDEPDARFIDIVPRSQWHQLVPDKAIDRGLLLVDRANRRLLFEGVKERYVIPADAIVDCDVEPMMPHTGNWNFYAVVLRVRYPVDAPASVAGGHRGEKWEVPLLPRPTQFRRYSAAYRRELAETLRDDIEELLESRRSDDTE